MMTRLRGQALSEFVISLVIILMACFGMQIYVKRGLQGRYYDVVQEGTAPIAALYKPYEPYYVASNTTVARDERIREKMEMSGALNKVFTTSEYDSVSNRWSSAVEVQNESTDNTNVEGGNLVWQY